MNRLDVDQLAAEEDPITMKTMPVPMNAVWQQTFSLVVSLWNRIVRMSKRAPRRLRLCESLPLGERRFIAVVEFEQSRFLVGGTSSSLVLLARLGGEAVRASGLPLDHSESEGLGQRMSQERGGN